jgi:hypothetical protein
LIETGSIPAAHHCAAFAPAAPQLGFSHYFERDTSCSRRGLCHNRQTKTDGGSEELIMEANASVLQGWEIDQLFKLRERQLDLLD